MAELVALNYSISLDGYGAGPDQSLKEPLGIGGEGLHDWVVDTQSFRRMSRQEGGRTGVDNDFTERGMTNIGAWILGRNMFGPVRGPWPDESWRGWWGQNPPYHVPVFVLTHHPRQPVTMEGGTVFHFVTDGIHAATERARAAAGDRDIRVGGGAATIRQYLQARLLDRMHLAVSPILLGSGEHLFAGIDLRSLGYRVTEATPGEKAVHYTVVRE